MTTDELTTRARFMRNAAPQAYLDFLKAFEAYTHRKIGDLVEADLDFHLAQGRAQQCIALLRVLDGVKNG